MSRQGQSRRISRRRVLQALGLSTALSPLVPLLNASAQENVRPKRLLLLYSPDGAAALDWNTVTSWRPSGTETDFTLANIHAPLAPFQSKLVIPWGLTLTAGGAGENHALGMAGLWTAATLHGPSAGADFDGGNGHRTGWGSGPSIDQLVARAHGPGLPYERPADDPEPETPFRSVELGVQTASPTSLNRMIYAGDNAPIHPETNPGSAFNRLFAGVDPTGSDDADAAAAAVRAEQQALVDYLKGDLSRVRSRVGKEDYQKLDAHLEGLLAIERRLSGPSTGGGAVSCSVPEAPDGNNAFPAQIRQMMDIAVHALACDVTRVMSLQLSYAFSYVTHTWLGHNSQHHTMSHDGEDRRRELQEIDTWYAEQVAYLLEKLDSIPEGDGTLLDNTLVVWGRELGATSHRLERVPFVMAGGARGALRTGRFLDFDRQPHAKLLVSIGQLMGLDIESIGDREPNSGGLAL